MLGAKRSREQSLGLGGDTEGAASVRTPPRGHAGYGQGNSPGSGRAGAGASGSPPMTSPARGGRGAGGQRRGAQSKARGSQTVPRSSKAGAGAAVGSTVQQLLSQTREQEWEFRASRIPQAKFVHFRRRRDGEGAGRLILRANRALRRQIFPLEEEEIKLQRQREKQMDKEEEGGRQGAGQGVGSGVLGLDGASADGAAGGVLGLELGKGLGSPSEVLGSGAGGLMPSPRGRGAVLGDEDGDLDRAQHQHPE